MTDRYEMPHPRADECRHAGVGKACRPCRDHFVVPEAAVEAARTAARLHSTTEPPPHEYGEVCCGECGEAIAYPGCTAEETSERAWRHTYRAALTAALPLLTAVPKED